MLSTKKNKISDKVINSMIQDMDKDSNGTISKDELLLLFKNLDKKN